MEREIVAWTGPRDAGRRVRWVYGHVSYCSYPQSLLFSFSTSVLTVHSKLLPHSLNSTAPKLQVACVVLVWFSEIMGKKLVVGVENNSFEVFFLICFFVDYFS